MDTDCILLSTRAQIPVTAQIALDLFESLFEQRENTRSVPYVIKLHSSMFDAVIGQIQGELSSYAQRL